MPTQEELDEVSRLMEKLNAVLHDSGAGNHACIAALVCELSVVATATMVDPKTLCDALARKMESVAMEQALRCAMGSS